MFLEYADWPEVWRDLAVSRPWRIVALDEAGRLCDPAALTAAATALPGPDVLFPKLGPKSWRDGSGLSPLVRDAGLVARVVRLLQKPTAPQQILIRQMRAAGAPLRLYLFPWEDMTRWGEARVHVSKRGAYVRSWRGDLRPHRAAVEVFAARVFAAAPAGPPALWVDVGFGAAGDCRLIEVNPIVSPKQPAGPAGYTCSTATPSCT